MDNAIFKEYDIRGIVDKQLDKEDVYLIARAFGSYIVKNGGKVVCTNYDGRESSPEFSAEANKGLRNCGLKVLDCGMGTTPMNFYAIDELDVDGGIMITASHNPKDYDGMKLTLRGEHAFFGDMIKKLIPIIDEKDFINGEGTIEKKDIKEDYINRMLKDLELDKDLKIVWDNGNGASGEILQEIVKKIKGEHTILYGEIDGSFPNHVPDPSVHSNLKDLQDKVLELGADVGFAFDGDGDRTGVITNKGEIIDNDILLAMFAKEELKKEPGGAVIGDVKCSKVLFDKIEEYGGVPLIWNTGSPLVKNKLKEVDAILAGELAGHVFFNRGFYGHDDGMYAAIKMLNILNNEEKTLSEMLEEYPKAYVTEENRIEVPEEDKFRIVDDVQKAFLAKSEFDTLTIDGIRATSEDGIIMFRASNTQNLIGIRCESLVGEENLERLIKIILDELEKAGVSLKREDIK